MICSLAAGAGLCGMSIPPADQLTLRLTVIGGETRADDCGVIWNGFTIGRIMKQSGLPPGRPSWSWSIIFAHRPQLAWQGPRAGP